MKRTGVILTLTSAMLIATAAHAVTQKEAAKAIHQAVNATEEVKELGFMWRDAYKKYIGPAKEAYREGHYDRAASLADAAQKQAELARAQYEDSRQAGPRF